MMSLLWTLIVGLVVGLIARLLMPGRQNMGWILTLLLGISGSVLATYVGQVMGWYDAGVGAGFIASVAGAVVVLLLYGLIARRR